MFFVTIACLSAQMREIDVAEETSPPKFITYIWWMDLVFVIFTLGELLLKVNKDAEGLDAKSTGWLPS